MLDVTTGGFLCFLVLINCVSETSSSLLPSKKSQALITDTQLMFSKITADNLNMLVSCYRS